MEFQRRILQWILHAGTTEARSHGADDQARIAAIDRPDNKAADHHIVINVDKSARADVREQGNAPWTEVVYFDNSNTGRATDTPHHHGVRPWRQRPHDR